jgi:hypothetical protein
MRAPLFGALTVPGTPLGADYNGGAAVAHDAIPT